MLRQFWVIVFGFGSFWLSGPSFAQKTNNPVYEDPFDLGAGGASLTKASGAAQLFANPALLPYGGTFHRWFGLDLWVISNKESVDTAQQILESSGSEEEQTEEEQAEQNLEFVDKVFNDPVHTGWGTSLSWVTNNGGVGVFSRFEPDIRARKRGSTGVPEVQVLTESYHGAMASLANRSPWRALSVGATAKYMYVLEDDLSIEITDEASIAEVQDPGFSRDLKSHNSGLGLDAGFLLFFQGDSVDFRLAGKVDDIGDTQLAGDKSPTAFKQVVSGGLGLTFHTGADALHFSADYRDILSSYEEDLFKKVYVGTKLTIRTYLGFSTGYYHGYQSYGFELDLILLRLAATYYTKEYGDSPGVDPRRLYLISLALGY